MTVTTPSSSAPFDILTPEFKRDINAYLGRLPASAPMKSLADIIAYNNAHADEAIKWGQGQLTASQATDLTDPAQLATYTTARDTQRTAAQAAIDKVLTDNTLDALMTPSGTLTGIGARAGYPQIVVPAGYNATNRLPVGIAFNGTAYSEAKLLAFAYAYEQKTHAAPDRERDQPRALALRAGQRRRRRTPAVRARRSPPASRSTSRSRRRRSPICSRA